MSGLIVSPICHNKFPLTPFYEKKFTPYMNMNMKLIVAIFTTFLAGINAESQIKFDYDKFKKDLIARTGSAEIYKSEDDGKKYILKYFTDEMRRCREIEICRVLSEKNLGFLPKFYNTEEHVLMEMIDGRGFKDYLKDQKFNHNQLKKIITDIFINVMELHINNIVHADIHGSNILIDKNEKVFLIDFGEAWIGNDFYFDFLRIKTHILDVLKDKYMIDWTGLIDYERMKYPKAMQLIVDEFYQSNSLIFWNWLNPNACRMNFYIVDTVAKILRSVWLDNTININEKYISLIKQNK